MKNKKQKVIVITGGGSGLGRALAERFSKSGDFLICLLGRDLKKLQETSKMVDSKNPPLRFNLGSHNLAWTKGAYEGRLKVWDVLVLQVQQRPDTHSA